MVVDEGQLAAATTTLLDRVDAARVALVVNDDNDARRAGLERSLVRVVRERRREDVVSPAMVRARLGTLVEAQLTERARDPAGLAADHLLLVELLAADGGAVAQLRLVVAATGAVVGTEKVPVTGTTTATTAKAGDLQRAAEDMADAFAEAVEGAGIDIAAWQVAVPAATATGGALTAHLDRHVAAELSLALRERGFLVVERRQIAAAMNQLALAQLTSTEDAGALGKVLGAQGLVLAQVAEDGASFQMTARLVGVETGAVLGASAATVAREGVVGLSSVETRTPIDSGLRSLAVPGWGQVENGEVGKAVFFGVGSYGALATTAALGVASVVTVNAYNNVSTSKTVSAAEATAQAVALRQQANTLLTATAIAGGVTAVVWAFNVVDAFANGD
jgi:hypothetical protein